MRFAVIGAGVSGLGGTTEYDISNICSRQDLKR